VALRPGCELGAEDVIAYCRERLAAYKYPREIRFVGELPKGPSGKILKSALRDGVLCVVGPAGPRQARLMKLDAHDRAQLVMIAYETRIVTPS
jgi:hypothetical protein